VADKGDMMTIQRSQRIAACVAVITVAVFAFILWTRHLPEKARALAPVITKEE